MNRIIEEIKRLWRWLWAKRSEVAQMDYKDALMAQIVLEILQPTNQHEFRYVSLFGLQPIHPIDNRENTIKATAARADSIRPIKEELLGFGKISKEKMAEIMPSATYVRAIPSGDGQYFSFEGNGRVGALKQVFGPEDGIEIELDLYRPGNIRRIQKRIRKLRRMHGLI